MTIPVLETERLVLRPHRSDDFDALAAMWADPDVVRHIGGVASKPDESWARLLRYAGHWSLLGFGYWAVETKRDGRFVGDVGFADWRRELTPSLDGLPEAGWVFLPTVHRQGIASEALTAALTWGDKNLGKKHTACIIDDDNLASIRLAERHGYREFARSLYKNSRVIQFRR